MSNDWSTVVLNASANNIKFEQIHITTLYNSYVDKIQDMILAENPKWLIGMNLDYDRIDRRFENAFARIEKQEPVYVKPYVSVPADKNLPIEICLNVDEIPLDIHSEVIELLLKYGSTPGTHFFGKEQTYHSDHCNFDPDTVFNNMNGTFI